MGGSIHYLNLKVAIEPTFPDPNWSPTNEYIDLGTSQFWSVPYTLFATRSSYADSTSTITNILPSEKGGTGLNNKGKTISLANNIITKGVGDLTITTTAASNVIFPTTGTLSTLNGVETLLNKTLISPILNGKPVAVTPDSTSADSSIATTLFVNKQINKLSSNTAITASGKLNISDTAAMLSPYATITGAQSLTNKIINGITPTALANGFSIAGGTITKTTVTVVGDVTIGGMNSGDQLITLTGDVSGSGTGTFPTTINSVGGVSAATISNLPTRVITAETNIASNTTSITANIADITTNRTNIATNTSNIATNTASITANTNSIATKLNITDTLTMLSPYALKSNTENSLLERVKYTDTAGMLNNYARKFTKDFIVRLGNVSVGGLSIPKNLGKYVNGQTVPATGKTLDELFDDITTEAVSPNYNAPSVSISSNIASIVEMGSTFSITLNSNFIQNDGGAATSTLFKSGATSLGSNTESVANITSTKTYSVDVQYGIGPIKNNNLSIPDATGRINASMASASLTITPTFKKYWGASSSSTPTDAEFIAASSDWANSNAMASFNIAISGTAKYIFYAIPTTLVDISSIKVGGFDSYNAFTRSARNIVNASGYSGSYIIYVSKNLSSETISNIIIN